MAGLYKSEKWLRKRYLVDKKPPQAIADECNVALMTIYRYLDKFGFKR